MVTGCCGCRLAGVDMVRSDAGIVCCNLQPAAEGSHVDTVNLALVLAAFLAVCIGEASYKDHNEVNEGPYATSAASEQLRNACTCLAYIETVYSKATEEKAKQQYHKPLFVTFCVVCSVLWILVDPCTALGAYCGILVHFGAAVLAIGHIIGFYGFILRFIHIVAAKIGILLRYCNELD